MEKIDILIKALKNIAAPYEVQKELYPEFVCLSNEIANELDCLEFLNDTIKADGRFNESILGELKEIDRQFISISIGEEKYHEKPWEKEAVKKDLFWQNQRNRAAKILKELGVTL